jgi:hypothetical protein
LLSLIARINIKQASLIEYANLIDFARDLHCIEAIPYRRTMSIISYIMRILMDCLDGEQAIFFPEGIHDGL